MIPRGEWRSRGSASVELALWAAPVAVVLGLLLGAGRVVMADGQVEQAAAEAARTASIARTAGAALNEAQAAAYDSLAATGPACLGGGNVAVDVSEFSAPPGVPAQVSVTVTCTVTFDELGIPVLDGTRTLSATAVSPLDIYRER